MTLAEVERVLLDFEVDVLKTMQMKLEGSYPARLDYKGKVFKIAFDDKHNVKGIVPL
jgi:ATP phosphoribosyltransferase regulatory subunit HisZ